MDIITGHSAWLIVSITLIAVLIWRACYREIYKKVASSKSSWHKSAIYAINIPLQILLLLFGALFTIEDSFPNLITGELFSQVKLFYINIFFLSVILIFINKVEVAMTDKKSSKFDKTTVRAISQLSRVVVTLLIAISIITPVFGVPISALLAFGGVGGIAVALACQDLLGNIFGGFYLYLDRPFNIGDKVYSKDRDIEGVVENIGWRLTTIRTYDNELKYVPNSLFSKIIIANSSRK